MNDQFCPMCGEEELLVRWTAEDIWHDSEQHLVGRAWACDACGFEADDSGLPSIAELLAADSGDHVWCADLAVVAKAVQKYLQETKEEGAE